MVSAADVGCGWSTTDMVDRRRISEPQCGQAIRRTLAFAAAAAILVGTAAESSATVQFGRPDYSNYLSRPKTVACDWQYPNYLRACPTPHPPPKPAEPSATTKSGQS